MEMKLDIEKLKALRESKAWSQSHLAEVAGVSLRTIQRIEKLGIASPESVKSICAVFEIEVDDIRETRINVEVDTGTMIYPSLMSVIRDKLSRADLMATIVAFCIAFIIAIVSG